MNVCSYGEKEDSRDESAETDGVQRGVGDCPCGSCSNNDSALLQVLVGVGSGAESRWCVRRQPLVHLPDGVCLRLGEMTQCRMQKGPLYRLCARKYFSLAALSFYVSIALRILRRPENLLAYCQTGSAATRSGARTIFRSLRRTPGTRSAGVRGTAAGVRINERDML